MERGALHTELIRALAALRRADGGFATNDTGLSELEPTIVAALALVDRPASAWLRSRQCPDGGFDELDGRATSPTTGALASLVLRDLAARRALEAAIEQRGLPLPNAPGPDRRAAWGWTSDARSLVEPTSRVLIAVKAIAPENRAIRAEAVRLLRERQCSDGGWNYGNASVYDVDLRGYAQTTAMALIALQGESDLVVGPGVDFLRTNWRHEPGVLTIAQAIVAFRLHGVDAEVPAALEALASGARDEMSSTKPLPLAWAVLATGPDALLEPLRPRT